MPDQTSRQCERTNDHESHTWFDNPKMWCPGVISPGIEPRVLCGHTRMGRPCVLPHDHDVHEGTQHRDDSGNAWWASVAEDEEAMKETRPMPDWAKPEDEFEDLGAQCNRVTAHGGHEWEGWGGMKHWCPGVKAHHNTQIGKGGPHDPHRHDYRKDYA